MMYPPAIRPRSCLAIRVFLLCAAGLALGISTEAVAQAAAPSGPGAPEPVTRAMVIGNATGEFARMDANHDGVLSKAEIEQYERAKIEAMAQARNKMVFDQLDTNHDGMLSRDEFARIVGTPPALNVDPLVAQLDTNHDGKISRDEYVNGILAKFDRADINHDGVVTPDEARAAARAQAAAKK